MIIPLSKQNLQEDADMVKTPPGTRPERPCRLLWKRYFRVKFLAGFRKPTNRAHRQSTTAPTYICSPVSSMVRRSATDISRRMIPKISDMDASAGSPSQPETNGFKKLLIPARTPVSANSCNHNSNEHGPFRIHQEFFYPHKKLLK